MKPDVWIVVPNWDRFQHYSDRTPTWIKLYLELRDKDEWLTLSFAQRGLLVSIWMEYASSKGALRGTVLAQKCGQKILSRTLDSLVRQGFIVLSASKPLALARSREKRREDKKKRPNESGKNNRPSEELEPLPLEQALEVARQLADRTPG